MPAERGPSGTGHEDGFERESIPEWVAGMACQSSYPHEAHGSCPGLRRPSDPPVAVPGPASASNSLLQAPGPASVSPADTPADALQRWILWSARNADEEADGLERLAALLAVGERDRAEIERLAAESERWERRAWNAEGRSLKAGERDRQQIARLTEALQRIASATDVVVSVGGSLRELPYYSANGSPFPHEIARAVLAGEEDAAKASPTHTSANTALDAATLRLSDSFRRAAGEGDT